MILESDCDQSSTSNRGAYGLMQVTPDAYEDSCKGKVLGNSDNKKSYDFDDIKDDAEKNINCGIKHLKTMYKRYGEGIKNSWAYKNNAKFKRLVDKCIGLNSEYGEYSGWDAALRGYNGWGCSIGSDTDYNKKIEEITLAFADGKVASGML
jgi:hypothetical protein